jgi:hypothetical protein
MECERRRLEQAFGRAFGGPPSYPKDGIGGECPWLECPCGTAPVKMRTVEAAARGAFS